MAARDVLTTLVGVALGTAALLIGILLSGITYFLLLPLLIFAIPVLYGIWRVRRAALIELEDKKEPRAIEQGDAPLVETVSQAHHAPQPREAVQTSDVAAKT